MFITVSVMYSNAVTTSSPAASNLSPALAAAPAAPPTLAAASALSPAPASTASLTSSLAYFRNAVEICPLKKC